MMENKEDFLLTGDLDVGVAFLGLSQFLLQTICSTSPESNAGSIRGVQPLNTFAGE